MFSCSPDLLLPSPFLGLNFWKSKQILERYQIFKLKTFKLSSKAFIENRNQDLRYKRLSDISVACHIHISGKLLTCLACSVWMYWRTVWARPLSRVQESVSLVSGLASHVTNTGAVLH